MLHVVIVLEMFASADGSWSGKVKTCEQEAWMMFCFNCFVILALCCYVVSCLGALNLNIVKNSYYI